MAHDLCPWRMAYLFDNWLRRWIQRPERMLAPWVRPGMTVADVGCGMGVCSIAMARLVGDAGRVLAVDLQPEILRVLERRAARRGVAHRIETRVCAPDHLGLKEPLDFAVAFWMVHETPDMAGLLAEIADHLKPGGLLLVAEPRLHVGDREVAETVDLAGRAGLELAGRPGVRLSHAMLFVKPAPDAGGGGDP